MPRREIDDLYLVRPYYIVPDGKVGHDAYAVIRETIRTLDKVALARVVLTSGEHVISLEARDKGLMGMLLRYPYEVRDAAEYFDDIQDVKITQEMLDLAKHIVETKSGHFDPDKFEHHYEAALQELLDKKQKGLPIEKAARQTTGNVINLMDALKASLKGGKPPAEAKATPAKKSGKAKAMPKKKPADCPDAGLASPKTPANGKEIMFVFFSNRLGGLGSILFSIVLTGCAAFSVCEKEDQASGV